jgi:60 kDa SS-A/Ro ribonucleoprotein
LKINVIDRRRVTKDSILPKHTGGGAIASSITPYLELRRQTLAALLWEKLAYTSGSTHAKQVQALVPKCTPAEVASLAIECRKEMHLRHMPLFLTRELARHPEVKGQGGALVAETLYDVIQRADELTEFLALYWKDKKQPLSAGVKRGLGKAFGKFSAYQLAKYNRDGNVKLRDVLRMVRPTPINKDQSDLWKQVLTDTLPTPDTWEVALSAAKGTREKREVWERLLSENKLGGLAFLRNLRNMAEVGVEHASSTLASMGTLIGSSRSGSWKRPSTRPSLNR